MDSVIAGFLVKLGFTFDKEQLTKFQGTVSGVSKGMMNLAKVGVGAGVAITAAIAKANSEVNKLYTLSNNTGASVRSIRVLGNAFSAVGGSAQDVQTAIGNLAHNIKYLNFEPYLEGLGVSLREANGEVRDTSQVLLDLRDVLMDMPQEQGRALAETLGLGGIYEPMMKADFGAELERSKELFGEMNQIIGEGSEASHRFTNEFSRLGDVVKTGSMAIGSSLTDLLGLDDKMANLTTSVAKASTDFIKWQREIIQNSDGILDWANQSFLEPLGNLYRDLMNTKIGKEEFMSGLRSFVEFIIPEAQKPQRVSEENATAEQEPAAMTVERARTIHDRRLLATRGMRNNNPGNLRAGQGQIGTDSSGYAVFPTREAGYNAAARQLKGYENAGLDNIASIISKWAPSSENDTRSYINSVVQNMNAKGFDVGAYSKLDLSDSAMFKALLDSMINHEVGAGAENYFNTSTYERIIQKQSQNQWRSSVVKESDKRPSVTVNQTITISGVQDPQRIKREIDPANTVQNAVNNTF
ncbi:MAG TPA: hypothetical protein IAC66_07560 [Candidatus Aphodousia gallistercoris]|nr:hypothetical protein [Candidatus Aphodousia gallistercoris]